MSIIQDLLKWYILLFMLFLVLYGQSCLPIDVAPIGIVSIDLVSIDLSPYTQYGLKRGPLALHDCLQHKFHTTGMIQNLCQPTECRMPRKSRNGNYLSRNECVTHTHARIHAHKWDYPRNDHLVICLLL